MKTNFNLVNDETMKLVQTGSNDMNLAEITAWLRSQPDVTKQQTFTLSRLDDVSWSLRITSIVGIHYYAISYDLIEWFPAIEE